MPRQLASAALEARRNPQPAALDASTCGRLLCRISLNGYTHNGRLKCLGLESLATQSPDVWSYWDSLYFSTILQTTVGLGDILPNSTIICMVVALQILIGYALLVVVLDVVLAAYHGGSYGPRPPSS